MRYAVVSDIHANWQAWSAVRDDIHRRGDIGCILCLGDVVGYGPQPARVLDDVRKHCHNFVLGNHDAVVAGRVSASLFNDNARFLIDWTCAQLSPEDARFFAGVPMVLGDSELLCAHAEMADPEQWSYILEPEHARPSFEQSDARLMFVGHTHKVLACRWHLNGPIAVPAVDMRLDTDSRYLINVGSVGDPRDGQPTASYCIYDEETDFVSFHRLAFDYAGFQADLARSGLPVRPFFLSCLTEHTTADALANPVADMTMPAVPATERLRRKVDDATSIKHVRQLGDAPRRRRSSAATRTATALQIQAETDSRLGSRRMVAGLAVVASLFLLTTVAIVLGKGCGHESDQQVAAVAATGGSAVSTAVPDVADPQQRKLASSASPTVPLSPPSAVLPGSTAAAIPPATTAIEPPVVTPATPEVSPALREPVVSSSLPFVVESADSHLLRTDGDTGFAIFVRFRTVADGPLFARIAAASQWQPGEKCLYIRNGVVTYDIHSVGTCIGGPAVTDGNWHSVLLNNTPGGTVTLFLDGQKIAGASRYLAADGDSTRFHVGQGPPDFGGQFQGSIAQAVYIAAAPDEQTARAITAGGDYGGQRLFLWTPAIVPAAPAARLEQAVADAAATPSPIASPAVEPVAAVRYRGLLAYEGFEYDGGTAAVDKAGGYGWRDSWQRVGGNTGEILAGSLVADGSAKGLPGSGGHVSIGPSARIGRHLDTADDGPFAAAGLLDASRFIGANGTTLYVSVLMKAALPQDRYYEFTLNQNDLNDGGRRGGIGRENGPPGILLRAGAKFDTPIAPAGTGPGFMVMRIDFKDGDDNVSVYYNPSRLQEPASADAVGSGPMNFDGICIGAFEGEQKLEADEIRIGTTYQAVAGTAMPLGAAGEVARLIAGRKFAAAVTAAAAEPAVAQLLARAFEGKTRLLASFSQQRGKPVEVAFKSGLERIAVQTGSAAPAAGSITAFFNKGGVTTTRTFSLNDLTVEEKVKRLGADDPTSYLYLGLHELQFGEAAVAALRFEQSDCPIGRAVATLITAASASRIDGNVEMALKRVLETLHVDSSAGNYDELLAKASHGTYSTVTRKNFPRAAAQFEAMYGGTAFGTRFVPRLRLLSVLVGQGLVPGLYGKFYGNTEWSGKTLVSRIDEQLHFFWPNSPDPHVPEDQFSARWTGFVIASQAGKYTFEAIADDRLQVVFDGNEYPIGGTDGRVSFDADLQPGKLYPIVCSTIEFGGSASVELYWTTPAGKREIIPATNLCCKPE